MTGAQFEKHIDELLDDDFIQALKDECMYLFRSGALDVTEYEDTMRLPKLCLHVALDRIKCKYDPLDAAEFHKEAKNLETI